MSWARLDDDFWVNTKVRAVSNDALALYTTAISYCAHQENDGLLDAEMVDVLCLMRRIGDQTGAVGELVGTGLWELAGDRYQVHDFLRYNRSHAELEAERAENARRQKEWQQRQSARKSESRPNAVTNAVSDAVTNRCPVPGPGPDPVPGPGEEPGSDAAASGADAPPESPPVETARRKAPAHAEEYAALREACRVTPETEPAWRGELNFAAKKLAGWTRDAILDGTAEYRRHYPGAEITPAALAKWLPRWRSPPGRAPPGNGQVPAMTDEDFAVQREAIRARQQATGLPTTPREWAEYNRRKSEGGGP